MKKELTPFKRPKNLKTASQIKKELMGEYIHRVELKMNDERSEWCRENIGDGNWKGMFNPFNDNSSYYFKEKEHAIWFKTVWQ